MLRWIFITLLATQAATCGQKGPLTMPESQTATLAARASFSVPAP